MGTGTYSEKDQGFTFQFRKHTLRPEWTFGFRRTCCGLYTDNELPINWGYGIAMLHPKEKADVAKGRKVSLLRAMLSVGMPKHERAKVWKRALREGVFDEG